MWIRAWNFAGGISLRRTGWKVNTPGRLGSGWLQIRACNSLLISAWSSVFTPSLAHRRWCATSHWVSAAAFLDGSRAGWFQFQKPFIWTSDHAPSLPPFTEATLIRSFS